MASKNMLIALFAMLTGLVLLANARSPSFKPNPESSVMSVSASLLQEGAVEARTGKRNLRNKLSPSFYSKKLPEDFNCNHPNCIEDKENCPDELCFCNRTTKECGPFSLYCNFIPGQCTQTNDICFDYEECECDFAGTQRCRPRTT